MSVTSERQVTSEGHVAPGFNGKAQVPHYSASAACCEFHAGHEQDQEHDFEVVEVLRVVFVALALAAVWFHLREPFPGRA
jgi:hypothetical protein